MLKQLEPKTKLTILLAKVQFNLTLGANNTAVATKTNSDTFYK